jgi:protocatechuate 3,4-dioxygenase beta subunit
MDEASSSARGLRRGTLPLALALTALIALVAVTRPSSRPRAAAAPDVPVLTSRDEPRPSPLVLAPRPETPRGSPEFPAKEAARVAADAGAAAEESAAPASTEQGPEGFRLVVRALEHGRASAAMLELTHVPTRGEATTRGGVIDASGELTLTLAPGRVRLIAWSESALARPLELELPCDDIVELELLPALAVEGRVTDATTGAPVAGAALAFWTAAELDLAHTDADGRFRHPRFPADGPAQQLCVRAEGFGKCVRYLRVDADGAWKLAAAQEGEASLAGRGTPFLELALVPETRITGRVLAADGAPLAGARVTAEGYFRARPSIAVRDLVESVSGTDGGFELVGLRSDVSHALVVEAAGHARLERELVAARAHALGDVALAAEQVIAGVVIDADGQPLADVEVVLTLDEATATDPDGLDAAARVLARERRTRTDTNGAFVFAGVASRRHSLQAVTTSDASPALAVLPDARGAFAPPCLQLACVERGTR